MATAMGLDTDDVLIGRKTLAEWQDVMVVIGAALDDVEADLRGRPPAEEYRAAFRHLYAAAEPLRRLRIEPRAVGAMDVDD